MNARGSTEVIVASIGVIAELLRVPKTGAVAEHQPSMRPHHSDMVGDVARVRRASADVNHGDAAAA
jgi:hypothetical protein